MKVCSQCGIEKPLSEFNKAKAGKFGVKAYCKLCQAKYRQNNREKIAEYMAEYRQNNREKIAEYYQNSREKRAEYYQNNQERFAEYYQNNRGKIVERMIEYNTKRYKNDPIFRLTRNLRTRLWIALKDNSKSASTFELIGMSGSELMDYLEPMFRDDMTRGNHGSVWHIDHIIPCSHFDLSDPMEQRICFNYQNLQPLLASENLSKHDKLPDNHQELYNKIKESLQC